MTNSMEWQSIETAPKDGSQLLLGGPGWADVGSWRVDLNGEKDEGWSCEWVKSWGYEEYAYCKPTHWQPRPEPPSSKGE